MTDGRYKLTSKFGYFARKRSNILIDSSSDSALLYKLHFCITWYSPEAKTL